MALTKSRLFLISLLLFSLIFLIPWFKPGLPSTDDASLMVIRASAFHQSFTDGHFPVRWLSRLNENYGYPVTNFLYPLPFYLSETLNLTGFSSLLSVKAIFIISTILSAFAMYLWLKPKFSTLAAFLASLFYLTSPYRFQDLYQRGSFGETVSFAIAPFIFVFIDHYISTKQAKHLIMAALFYALLITAHNSLAFLFTPMIIGYLLILLIPSKKLVYSRFLKPLLSFLTLTLCMSAFFWLPALWDLQYTRAGTINISSLIEHFSAPPKLLLQVGLVSILVAWWAIFKLKKPVAQFFIVILSVAVLMQIPASFPIWQLFALDRLVQFPFRFMALVTFSTAFLLGRLTHLYRRRKAFTFALTGLVLAATFLRLAQVSTVTNQTYSPGFFDTNFDTTTNQREFTPRWVTTDPTTHAPHFYSIQILGDKTMPEQTVSVTEENFRTGEQFLQAVIDQPINITFNTHYFPGWNLYVDDLKTDFDINSYGTISTRLDPPERRSHARDIKLVWQETPLRSLANLISAISALLVFSYLIHTHLNNRLHLTLGALSLVILLICLGWQLVINRHLLLANFDPVVMEEKYLSSQWVDPKSETPLGDHGLYTWAGWQYVHGHNPILINSEAPPLGKYLIGLGLVLTAKPGLVGLFFSLTSLVSLYLLANQTLSNRFLALTPVALFTTETIFTNSLFLTMLDTIQLTFLNLCFYFLAKKSPRPIHFILASLAIGGVLATKFYSTGLLVIVSIIIFYATARKLSHLATFIITLPFAGLVHMASYLRFFLLGNTLRDYLGVQKYVFDFYSHSDTSVPLGSYWLLVFFNRWRVWWGPRWGEYYTLITKEWRPLWPINAFAALVTIFSWLQAALNRQAKRPLQPHFLLASWLLVYSAFLTIFGGWPHYMLLFLPFSNILLVHMTYKHRSQLAILWHKLINNLPQVRHGS